MRHSLMYWSLGIGAAHMALGYMACMWTERFRRLLDRFPRHVGAGRALSAFALLWAALIVRGTNLGRFEPLKPALFVAAPLTWGAVVWFMDELLAPRALGGLLLLLARPLLEAARLHPHPAARVASVLAYLWVAAGMTLVAAPWWFRRTAAWSARSPSRWRATAVSLLVTGAAFLILAFTVYA